MESFRDVYRQQKYTHTRSKARVKENAQPNCARERQKEDNKSGCRTRAHIKRASGNDTAALIIYIHSACITMT